MRLIKFKSFIILISLIIPLNLFSWISSRVEGTIVDEETGQPITGAYVGLFQCSIHGSLLRYTSRFNDKAGGRYIETNDKGYFLVIFKEGYAAVGPFYYKKPGSFDDGKYWPGGMEPGKYTFNIYSIGGGTEFDFEMILNITTTSIIEINKVRGGLK